MDKVYMPQQIQFHFHFNQIQTFIFITYKSISVNRFVYIYCTDVCKV